MNRQLKIITTAIWGLSVLAMVGVVAGVLVRRPGGQPDRELPVLYPAPTFSLTNQNGQTVTDQALRGTTWIAGFVFTRCTGPCPMMTQKMAAMQGQVTNPNVKFVLFTVDPEHDTPEVLTAFAEKYKADQSRWHLLTGPTPKLYEAAAGMKVTAIPANGENPIVHSQRFLLVDPEGQVRAAYDSLSDDDLARLAADATELAGG
jgi:protein SCO1